MREFLASCVVLAAVVCLAGAHCVYGEPFVYEGFQYDPGELAGNNGGVGFSGPWVDAGGDVNAEVLAEGLTFTNGSGDKFLVTSGRCAAFLSEPGNTTQCRYQRELENNYDSDVEFWSSYLFRPLTDNINGESCFVFGFDPGQNIGQYNRVIGSGKKHNVRAFVNRPYTFDSSQTPTGGPLDEGKTYFAVGKIKLWKVSQSETGVRGFDITWWRYEDQVDDVPTNAPTTGGVRTVGTGSTARILMRLGFYMAPNNNVFAPFVIDEIRAGYTYEDVAPLAPEPGITLVSALVAIAALRKRA